MEGLIAKSGNLGSMATASNFWRVGVYLGTELQIRKDCQALGFQPLIVCTLGFLLLGDWALIDFLAVRPITLPPPLLLLPEFTHWLFSLIFSYLCYQAVTPPYESTKTATFDHKTDMTTTHILLIEWSVVKLIILRMTRQFEISTNLKILHFCNLGICSFCLTNFLP